MSGPNSVHIQRCARRASAFINHEETGYGSAHKDEIAEDWPSQLDGGDESLTIWVQHSPPTIVAATPIRQSGAHAHDEDVNGDGLLDLLVHCGTEALTLSEGESSVILTGKTYAGTSIQGSDSVWIVPWK